MNTQQKTNISAALKQLANKSSQAALAQQSGVSTAMISQMINQKWQLISIEMWRKVMKSFNIASDWATAETTNFRILNQLLNAAKTKSISICISHDAGAGKSHTYKHFNHTNKDVMYLECKNYWSKKAYVRHLLLSVGVAMDATTEMMIENYINIVRRMEQPLLIIDQVDKLKDPQLDLFMDLYNELDGHCGFVLSGVPALKKRILKGVQRDKIGYRELYSRIGRKFIELDALKLQDVIAVCQVNGITDEQFAEDVFMQSSGDLRRVKRAIDQYFLLKKAA